MSFAARHRRRCRRLREILDRSGQREVVEIRGFLSGAATARRTTQAAIEIGMRLFQVTDDFEVDALHLRQIDLLDVNQAQQFLDGPGHFATALVARAAALRYADLRPELLLVHAESAPDLARIQYTIEEFHRNSASVNAIEPSRCYTIGIWLRVRRAISRATDRRRANRHEMQQN